MKQPAELSADTMAAVRGGIIFWFGGYVFKQDPDTGKNTLVGVLV